MAAHLEMMMSFMNEQPQNAMSVEVLGTLGKLSTNQVRFRANHYTESLFPPLFQASHLSVVAPKKKPIFSGTFFSTFWWHLPTSDCPEDFPPRHLESCKQFADKNAGGFSQARMQ